MGENRSGGRVEGGAELVLPETRQEVSAPKLYGRKRSHGLSAQAQILLDDFLPLLEVSLEDAAQDPAQLFSPSPRAVWLEIGFGDGDHLAWQAAAHPGIGFLGCEPYQNGTARLLSLIAVQGQANVRIHSGDARPLLTALPVACIARVFILFPDPWPKKRHNKRRFISADSLAALARVMQPGAELLFASDSADYCQWALDHFAGNADFTLISESRGIWPVTKFEAKALAAGRFPVYLNYRRN